MFRPIDPKTQLADIEHKHLEYWKQKKIFEKSVEQRKGQKKFVFFDGPPFANGLPHYGHILAGTIKDAVTRYYSMLGYYVPRVNGWDCHGLPVEYEIEKELGLSGRQDIEKMGVEKFNQACADSVFRYTHEWETSMERMARWVDTENGYATLDATYMESIFWVFKEIWKKGLVEKGYKSMHVCPRCATPLSNFEVSQGYKDVTDLSATVMFKSLQEPETYFLAWTTTPWTLPGNTALAVNPKFEYAKVSHEGKTYILAKELIAKFFELDGLEIEMISGESLLGQRYEPLFDGFSKRNDLDLSNAFQVLAADFVDLETGTGIVHIAGGYGEDDLNLVLKNKLPVLQHVNMDGHFNTNFPELEGKFCKSQDQNVAELLQKKDRLFKKENLRHSYPHCWRCDTPLLNFANEAWFVLVTRIKEKLIANNKKIHWQPEHIQEGRFGKWLENVRDWNISRNRYWGCPIPVWVCDACGTTECIGSMEELKAKAGHLPEKDGAVNLHKPYIDALTWTCEKCTGTMTRIPEVLDCWFESGAMPYAQLHYPFENKEEFEQNFPAEFIAEGLDQTRGWFYTLHVLSTILFDQPAFKNVIVNGILLAKDGEKLSKRKKNYPDPKMLFEEKGVDTVRFFLLNSTATLAEDVRFSDDHVDELLKRFTLTLWNTYSFFVTYANIDQFEPQSTANFKPENKLDQWILSELQELIAEVTKQMNEFNLSRATRPIVDFTEELSNWYVRRSRRRFWKSENDGDKSQAYQTLHTVLVELSKLIAPFMPFVSDEIYRNLTSEESVHLADWPTVREDWLKPELGEETRAVRTIVNLGHAVRSHNKIRVRQPLSEIRVAFPSKISSKTIEAQIPVILEELNVKTLSIMPETELLQLRKLKLNARVLGPLFGGKVQTMIQAAQKGEWAVDAQDQLTILGETLPEDSYEWGYEGENSHELASEKGWVVQLKTEITEDLLIEGYARELIRFIQDLRKEAGYEVSDRIQIAFESSPELEEKLRIHIDKIKEETLCTEWIDGSKLIEAGIERELDLEGHPVKLKIKKSFE